MGSPIPAAARKTRLMRPLAVDHQPCPELLACGRAFRGQDPVLGRGLMVRWRSRGCPAQWPWLASAQASWGAWKSLAAI